MHLQYNRCMIRSRSFKLIIAILWTISIIGGSLMSGSSLSSTGMFNIPYFDKILHFTAYFLFVFFWINALNNNSSQKLVIQTVIVGVLLGVGVEFAQMNFTLDRHYENLDIIANIIGSIGGGLTSYWITKTR